MRELILASFFFWSLTSFADNGISGHSGGLVDNIGGQNTVPLKILGGLGFLGTGRPTYGSKRPPIPPEWAEIDYLVIHQPLARTTKIELTSTAKVKRVSGESKSRLVVTKLYTWKIENSPCYLSQYSSDEKEMFPPGANWKLKSVALEEVPIRFVFVNLNEQTYLKEEVSVLCSHENGKVQSPKDLMRALAKSSMVNVDLKPRHIDSHYDATHHPSAQNPR